MQSNELANKLDYEPHLSIFAGLLATAWIPLARHIQAFIDAGANLDCSAAACCALPSLGELAWNTSGKKAARSGVRALRSMSAKLALAWSEVAPGAYIDMEAWWNEMELATEDRTQSYVKALVQPVEQEGQAQQDD